jgi:hypothetical protein
MSDSLVTDLFREMMMGNSSDEIYLDLASDPGIATLQLVFKEHRLCTINNECPF